MTKLSLSLILLSLCFGGIKAAGNDEIVYKNVGVLPQDAPNRTSYQCTFRNLWTKESHPKNYPEQLARWNGPIMWTHTLQFQPWLVGFATTRGVEKIAEDGFTDTLIEEMINQGEQVHAYSDNPNGGFFTAQQDFVHMPPLETTLLFPYLSVAAGMSPSPDWYTGFYSFWLTDEYSRTWYDHIKIQTYAWDAGTDAGTTYTSLDSDLEPPIPIQRFVANNAPENGELRGPDGESMPVVAEWECFLVVGDVDMIMPECDWFANPCCNETDKVNCGAMLPNGAPPKLSPEYEAVQRARGEPISGAAQQFSMVAVLMGIASLSLLLS